MSRELGKAVVFMALAAGGLYAYERWYAIDLAPSPSIERGPQNTAELAPTTSVTAPADPPSTDLSTETSTDEHLIATPVIATVYECQGSEGRTLSDKPCAIDARSLQVRAPNGMDPTKAAATEESKADGASSLSLQVTIPPLKTCAQLDASEALVKKRLRENYSEEYKEEFRQKLRGYADTRKEWNCGRAR